MISRIHKFKFFFYNGDGVPFLFFFMLVQVDNPTILFFILVSYIPASQVRNSFLWFEILWIKRNIALLTILTNYMTNSLPRPQGWDFLFSVVALVWCLIVSQIQAVLKMWHVDPSRTISLLFDVTTQKWFLCVWNFELFQMVSTASSR